MTDWETHASVQGACARIVRPWQPVGVSLSSTILYGICGESRKVKYLRRGCVRTVAWCRLRVNMSTMRSRSPGRFRTLLTVCACHVVHDGLSDVLYVFLPYWQAMLALSHSQVGVVVALYFAAMAAFQIPVGMLAERSSERLLIVVGTTLAGLGFLALGRTSSFAPLVAILMVAGLGSAVQHPLGASLVAKAYDRDQRRVAIGTFNFAGDLGKVIFPTLAGLALMSLRWRAVTSTIGIITVAGAILFSIALRNSGVGRTTDPPLSSDEAVVQGRRGIHNRKGFALLSLIGVIDTMTRYGFLTFLPFLLIDRGLSEASAGMALGLLFAGGAAGKFLCGLSAQRFGILLTVVVTEALTCVGILVLLLVRADFGIVLLPIIGAALNGTSSVLYGSVADFVYPERQARAFGMFYTVVIATGAIAPPVFGVVSDFASIEMAMVAVAVIPLLAIPLARQVVRNMTDERTSLRV